MKKVRLVLFFAFLLVSLFKGSPAFAEEKILLFGGVTYVAPDILKPLNDVWESNSSIDSWSRLSKNTFTPGSKKWSQRHDFASVYFKEKVFVIGGSNTPLTGEFYKDVWVTNNGVKWEKIADNLPWGGTEADQGLHDHTLTVFKNKLWIIGGYFDGGAGGQGGVWKSSDGINWAQTATGYDLCLQTRFGHQSVVFQDKLWLLGSYWAETKPDICSSPDGINFTVELYEAPWGERTGHMAIVFDNKLWIFGGIQDNQFACSSDIWYSENGITWTEAEPAPWPGRCQGKVVIANEKLWLIGGGGEITDEPEAWGLLNDVWSSEDGLTWVEVTHSAPWYDRAAHSAVTVPSDF